MLNRHALALDLRPGVLLAAVCVIGLLVMGCPSSDTTGTEYEPPATSAPQS